MSLIDVVVVPVTAEDSSKIYEYLIKHYDFHVPEGPPRDWRVTEKVVRQTIGVSDSSEYHEAFHAKDKLTGQVLGQICFYKRFDIFYGKLIQVGQILIDEKYRGNKIGLKLMREVSKVAFAKDCLMTWRAWHWNTPALKFYESIGGQRIKNVYSSNGAHHIHFLLCKDAIEVLAKSDDQNSLSE